MEIGFWDYTCPHNGSLERYTASDWDVLLDDMAAGGFDSLVLCPKWLTTGYRSRFPWLDQDPTCSAVALDNAPIHHALAGARARGIRTRLLIVATIFPGGPLALPGGATYPWPGFFEEGDVMLYDLDCPGLRERMDLLIGELVDLFGAQSDGLIIELEFADGEAPHRIPVYDAWAAAHGRPLFADMRRFRLESRQYPLGHWRDFTTARRIDTLQHCERLIRGRGYAGELASIIELENLPGVVMSNVNLGALAAALPHWAVSTYDSYYDRRLNRLATMDFCVEQPRRAGLPVQYLTRGVMTFPTPHFLTKTTLEEQWRMSLEDARDHKPDALWFMGADARLPGAVCSDALLPSWGFTDGRSARRRLMAMAREILAK
jgi:hypothetical protein